MAAKGVGALPKGHDLAVLLQGQSLEVLINDEPEASDSTPFAQPCIGVVAMCKQVSELDVETWLTFHTEHLGAQRFYLRIEDSDYLRPLLEDSSSPWASKVVASFVNEKTLRDWTSIATRQATHVMDSIELARADGLTHILSIDFDELLFLPHGREALCAAIMQAPSSACSLHVRNLEALMPGPSARRPFAQGRVFRHRPWEYGAYGYPPSSGKAFGVLGVRGLSTNGPHHFGVAGMELDGTPLGPELSVALPHGVAALLHFESSTYASWRLKFLQMAEQDSGKGRRFSPYYHASLEATSALLAAIRAAEQEQKLEQQQQQQKRDEEVEPHEPEKQTVALEMSPPEEGSSGVPDARAAQPSAREGSGGVAPAVAKAEADARAVWRLWRVEPPRVPQPPEETQQQPTSPEAVDVTASDAPSMPVHVIRCLRQLGLTTIDPPPGAAAFAQTRAARRARKAAAS